MSDRTYYYFLSTDNRTLRRCKLNCTDPDGCNNCVNSESSESLADTHITYYLAITNEQMDELERKLYEKLNHL